VDRYTKVVLTIIAFSLLALAVEQGATPAFAQPRASVCGGSPSSPCYIASTASEPVVVEQR
jgi:hypothetical protein